MEKLVYYFIWKGRLVKLSREQIRGNESSGGLGVMDIQKKADALLLKSLLRALCGRLGTTIQQAFSYWLGLPLRRIIGTEPPLNPLIIDYSNFSILLVIS